MGVRFQDGSPEQLFHALERKHHLAVDNLLYQRGVQNIGQPMILTILSQQKDGTIESQKELARRLREGHFQMEWENAQSGVVYDLLLVLCGCSARCASLEGLESRRDPILVDGLHCLKQVEQVLSEL